MKIDTDKKYYVNFAVSGRFCAEVSGKDLKTIENAGWNALYEADFGDAEDIDSKLISIEDEEGNIIKEL